MIKDYSVLALIPARGGSKRIPKKNIKLLSGKPLVSHAVNSAKKSKYIDRVIAVTDDDDIAKAAKAEGAEWPFREPAELADGTKPDFDFVNYTLQWLLDNENYKPDIIVQLRPTSPLRTAEHIDRAVELLAYNPEADSVRTVTEPEQTPYKMYKIDEGGYLSPLLKIDGNSESFNLPRQKLPKTYKHVGYVDAVWYRTIMEKKQMTGSKVLPLVLENAVSGIDDESDWELCEYLMRKKR